MIHLNLNDYDLGALNKDFLKKDVNLLTFNAFAIRYASKKQT